MFVVDFGTADDEKNWFCRILDGGFEILNFFLDEETGVNREEILNGIGGSMSTVNDGKTVLDVEVSACCIDDVINKIVVVFFFAEVGAEVFEKGDFGVCGDFNFLAFFREGVEADFLTFEKLFEAFCDGSKGSFRGELTFGATEVGNQNDFLSTML